MCECVCESVCVRACVRACVRVGVACAVSDPAGKPLRQLLSWRGGEGYERSWQRRRNGLGQAWGSRQHSVVHRMPRPFVQRGGRPSPASGRRLAACSQLSRLSPAARGRLVFPRPYQRQKLGQEARMRPRCSGCALCLLPEQKFGRPVSIRRASVLCGKRSARLACRETCCSRARLQKGTLFLTSALEVTSSSVCCR